MKRDWVRRIRLYWVRSKQRYRQFLDDAGGMPEDDPDFWGDMVGL